MVLVAVTVSIAIWALCVEQRAFSVLVHTANLSCARRCVGGREGCWNLLCWALALISQSSPCVLCFQLVHPPTGARTASTRATATMGPSAAPTTGNASALLAGRGSTARSVSGQPPEPKGSPPRRTQPFPVHTQALLAFKCLVYPTTSRHLTLYVVNSCHVPGFLSLCHLRAMRWSSACYM